MPLVAISTVEIGATDHRSMLLQKRLADRLRFAAFELSTARPTTLDPGPH